MLLRTHYVFTAGLVSAVLTALSHGHGKLDDLSVAFYLSIVGNALIDYLGHEVRGGYIRRTPLTHTYPRSVFWGFLPAVPLLLFGVDPLATAVAGLIVGPSHMFLDMFTEKGIYVRDGKTWRRFAVAHYRYDDPVANGVAVIIGTFLILTALKTF